MDTIKHDGDTWRILSTGRSDREERIVLCRLASTTRNYATPLAHMPIQMQDWLPWSAVTQAMDYPHDFFTWNSAIRTAFKRGIAARQEGLTINQFPTVWVRSLRNAWREGYMHNPLQPTAN